MPIVPATLGLVAAYVAIPQLVDIRCLSETGKYRQQLKKVLYILKIKRNYSAYQNMSIDVDSDENVENNK